MKHFLFSLTICFCLSATGQQNIPEYGRITQQELEMTSYPLDKTCDAVVLYDIGKSYFLYTDEGFRLKFERKTRIKIFKKAGISWADMDIPYYYEGEIPEKVDDIEATSYNIENEVINKTTLDTKQIFDEKTTDRWRRKRFAIPNVKEGSVIEFKYSITSPYYFNLQDWNFQWTIPVVYSEYMVKITPFYEYIYILQGRNKFDVFEKYEDNTLPHRVGSVEYQDMVYRFGLKNVPAFNDESFITSMNDYIIKVDFQLAKFHRLDGSYEEIITTWPKLITELLKHDDFGNYMKNSENAFEKLIDISAIHNKTQQQKLEYIANYVKLNYSWNGVNNYFATKTLKEFLKEKTGNAANLNLFLVGLLNAAGIEAYPVILSTRNHGKIKSEYPFAHFFDYVVVLAIIDGKNILTDATNPLCPYNKIPANCINEKGLVIKKNAEQWVLLANNEMSVLRHNFFINLATTNDEVYCNFLLSAGNYDALGYRTLYQNKTDQIEKYFNEHGYKYVDSITTENYFDPLKNYIIKAIIKLPVERTNEKIYISPFLLEPPEENPFKESTRQYPVDMIYLRTRSYNSIITVPPGYKIESVPDDMVLETNFVDISYKVAQSTENKINISAIYSYKKVIYEPADYANLRFTMSSVVKKLNEKVVLVKE